MLKTLLGMSCGKVLSQPEDDLLQQTSGTSGRLIAMRNFR